MSKTEYKDFLKNGLKFYPTDTGGGISVTSVKVAPKDPDPMKISTGALAADDYVDTNNKNVELKEKTKDGIMDWKIKDDVSHSDMKNKDKVSKC